LRAAIDTLAAMRFPAPRSICGAVFMTASRIPICAACFAWFEPIPQPMCSRRGRPFLTPLSFESVPPVCRRCRDDYYAFDLAPRYGVYNEARHRVTLLLKYEGVARLGVWFAALLAELVAREAGAFRADVFVPVPPHPEGQRERGYNQAELIARPLARRLHLTQGAGLLIRSKPRPRLVPSRKEHWDSVRGAYATRRGLRVDKLRVLLVDDVMTTGATLDSCAKALKSAGPARRWDQRSRE
jgi:competence protein ComFC